MSLTPASYVVGSAVQNIQEDEMKRLACVMVVLMLTASWLMAEGQTEIDKAGAAFVEELRETISESKDIVVEYGPKAIEGLIARKTAYYDAIFPTIPIITVVLAAIGIGLIAIGFVMDYEEFYTAIGSVFLIFMLVGLIWWIADGISMRMFFAAPEVTVIKNFLN